MFRTPQTSTLFPYTTLFRSETCAHETCLCAPRLGKYCCDYCEEASAHGPAQRCECIFQVRSEEHTSELQSRRDLVCRLLLEKKNESTVNIFTFYMHHRDVYV